MGVLSIGPFLPKEFEEQTKPGVPHLEMQVELEWQLHIASWNLPNFQMTNLAWQDILINTPQTPSRQHSVTLKTHSKHQPTLQTISRHIYYSLSSYAPWNNHYWPSGGGWVVFRCIFIPLCGSILQAAENPSVAIYVGIYLILLVIWDHY